MKFKVLCVFVLLLAVSGWSWAQENVVDKEQATNNHVDIEDYTVINARDAVSLPYSEGFENGLGQWSLVSCAYITDNDKTGVSERAKRSGNYGFLFYWTTQPPQYLISPEFSGTENGLTVEFYYKNAYSGYPESFQVGYSTTTMDIDAFNWDDVVTASNTRWTQYKNDFPSGTKYVSVKSVSHFQYYLYLDDFVFSSSNGCPAPSAPAITDVTTHSVALNWSGGYDSYGLKYVKYSSSDFEEGFGGWTTIDADGDGYGWKWSNNDASIPGHESNNMVYSQSYDNNWGQGGHPLRPNNYLVSPLIPLGGSISFYAHGGDIFSYDEHFGVAVSTTSNTSAASFTTIREWNTTQGWLKYTVDLSAYSGMGYVAIRHFNSYNKFQLEVDDVVITFPNPSFVDGIVENTYDLTGLDQGSSYSIQVRGACGDTYTNWSVGSNVTLPLGDRFLTSGNWNEASNWQSGSVPQAGSDVVIDANVIVPAGYVADAGNILVRPNAAITVKDGGQLVHNNIVEAVLEKNVAGFVDDSNPSGWYTLASPVMGDCSTDYLTIGNYDLYLYNEPTHMWWNAKGSDNGFNMLSNGQGYLYANRADKLLTFAGAMQPTDARIVKPLDFAARGNLKGYNLVGNPFTRSLSSGDVQIGNEPLISYLVIENGSELVPCNITDRPIKPGEGFFVQASEENQNLVFNDVLRSRKQREQSSYICIEVSNGTDIDRAFVQIGKGNTLRKMNLDDKHHKVYVVHEGKDFASATIAEPVGELPLNFEAEQNAVYSFRVSTKDLNVAYLHLVDNMTGADIDLLEMPNYTFNAKTTDYASRFKLVFDVEATEEASAGSSSFAFCNGANWVVDNEGKATLQVVDILGHVLQSIEIDGNAEVNLNVATGMYVLRLLSSDKVMTQKIVVE